MVGLFLMLALDIQTEMTADLAKYKPEDAKHIRYLNLENVQNQDDCFAVTSFILNTVSTSRTVVKPEFVNKNKTLMRFDLRDYHISINDYAKIENDPLSKPPLLRVEWFVVKAMISPTYYALMGVSNLNDFYERHGYNAKNVKDVKGEQAAVVVSGEFVKTARYLKRVPTMTGFLWESRSGKGDVDYLKNLLSVDYDTVQVLASNPNGLISYFIADSKGKPLDYLAADVAVDHTKAFDGDFLVRASRNCMVCHDIGVMSFKDDVRNILRKEVQIFSPDEKVAAKLKDLFEGDIPVEKDQKAYMKAVLDATDMEIKVVKGKVVSPVMQKYVKIWQNYYTDMTLAQVAAEMNKTEDEIDKLCRTSGNVHLVGLLIKGKMPRVYFEQMTGGK